MKLPLDLGRNGQRSPLNIGRINAAIREMSDHLDTDLALDWREYERKRETQGKFRFSD